jgi:hypothetical protein
MGRTTLPAPMARQMSLSRATKSGGANGGRPRTAARRCPCAVMTLKRAQSRGKSREHDPACPFYPSALTRSDPLLLC